jgi:hypothetical protein
MIPVRWSTLGLDTLRDRHILREGERKRRNKGGREMKGVRERERVRDGERKRVREGREDDWKQEGKRG